MATQDNAWRSLNDSARVELFDPLSRTVDYKWHRSSQAFLGWYSGWYKGKKRPDGTLIPEDDVFPEFLFNNALDVLQRNSLLCLWAKLRSQQLWSMIKSIEWVGRYCEMNFLTWCTPILKRNLLSLRYGPYMFANALGNWDWGLRSPEKGSALHFRGMDQAGEKVEVHIDRSNPGDSGNFFLGFYHLIADKRYRWSQDNPTTIRQEFLNQGITVPLVP